MARQRTKEETADVKRRLVDVRRKDHEVTATQLEQRFGVGGGLASLWCREAGLPLIDSRLAVGVRGRGTSPVKRLIVASGKRHRESR